MNYQNERTCSTLSRRDCFLLLLISALSACFTLCGFELLSSLVFTASKADSLPCMVLSDPRIGAHALPNCSCSYKIPEGDPVQYQFNSSGFRTGSESGPKPPGSYRFVLVGTSMAEGLHVPLDRTLAAQLPLLLSRQTGRNIEVYNEALEWESPHVIDQNFQQVLAAHPDIILWAVTKWDVENSSLVAPHAEPVTYHHDHFARAWQEIIAGVRSKSITQVAGDITRHVFVAILPKSTFLIRHLVFENEDEYVKEYLCRNQGLGFLQARPDRDWQSRLQSFDAYAADILNKARQAHVPVIVTVLPPRIEASLIAERHWPDGFDPYEFGRQVNRIISKHGAAYVDILQGFRDIANPSQYYFPVDTHPNAAGQALFADLLSRRLTHLVSPLLQTASANQPAPLNLPLLFNDRPPQR